MQASMHRMPRGNLSARDTKTRFLIAVVINSIRSKDFRALHKIPILTKMRTWRRVKRKEQQRCI